MFVSKLQMNCSMENVSYIFTAVLGEVCLLPCKLIFFNHPLAPKQAHRIYQLSSSLHSPFQFY